MVKDYYRRVIYYAVFALKTMYRRILHTFQVIGSKFMMFKICTGASIRAMIVLRIDL